MHRRYLYPAAAFLLLTLLAVPHGAATDFRMGVTYVGELGADPWDQPYISGERTLYYLHAAVMPSGAALGTFELREYTLNTKTESARDAFESDSDIRMLDNGAVFAPMRDSSYYGLYWNISDRYRRDTLLKTADGHDAYVIVYTERVGSFVQVAYFNALNGKGGTITTVARNHADAHVSGNTVVYLQFNGDWDLAISDLSGGPSTVISGQSGNEARPLIDGTTVVFSLDVPGRTELYTYNVLTRETQLITRYAGESYALGGGHILYYDSRKGVWGVTNLSSGAFHVFSEYDLPADVPVAVSERWACIGTSVFKLYDSPSATIPTLSPTTVPEPSVTSPPVTTLAPPVTTPPPSEEGNGSSGLMWTAGMVLLLAGAGAAIWMYQKRREA